MKKIDQPYKIGSMMTCVKLIYYGSVFNILHILSCMTRKDIDTLRSPHVSSGATLQLRNQTHI